MFTKFRNIFIAFLVISLVVFLLLPGIRVANDFPYVDTKTVASNLIFPQAWSEQGYGLGEYRVATLWTWPLDFVYAIGSSLQIDFSTLTKLIGIAGSITIAIFSIYKFLEYYKFGKESRILGTVVFSTCTYFILLIGGGQLSIAAAFGIFPLVFISFEKALFNNSLRNSIYAGIMASILGFFDVRFVYLLALVMFLKFIFSPKLFLNWIRTGLISLIVFLGLNAFWIIPSILIKSPILPSSYTALSAVASLDFTDSSHALFSQQPQWWQNTFGQIQNLNPFFVVLPLLAFAAPLISRRKEIKFFLILGVLGIFLAKGSNPPLENVYLTLFVKLPGFSLFRDSTKFFIFISLAYSFLITATIESFKKFTKKYNLLIAAFICLYLLILINPLWTGRLGGIFANQPQAKSYLNQVNVIASDNSFSRSLWIPTRGLFGYSSSMHPLIEATRLLDLTAFTSGTVGSYETLNFLRESPYVGQLLNILSVKYLAYPDVGGSEEQIKYHSEFLNQLKNLSWVDKTLTDSPSNILHTKQNQDHIFIIPNLAFVIGSERFYWPLSKVSNFDLSKLGLVFAQNSKNGLEDFNNYQNAKIILYQSSLIDAAAELIDSKEFVFPAKNLQVDPDSRGWWKRDGSDLISWRTFLQDKYEIDSLAYDYGGGWSVAEGNKDLKVNLNNATKSKTLLARVMKSSRGGNIQFKQDGMLIGGINTLDTLNKVQLHLAANSEIPKQDFDYSDGVFNWYEVGVLNSSSDIEIVTEGDVNVVNALASLDSNQWHTHKARVLQWKNENKLVYWEDMDANQKQELFDDNISSILTYKQLSQTHYKINISKLSKPQIIAFSDTYDSLWKINYQSGFKLFDLINGYYVTQPGVYDLYYIPQKYVQIGSLISLVSSLTILGIYIFKIKYKK